MSKVQAIYHDGTAAMCEGPDCLSAEFKPASRHAPNPFDDYDDYKLECAECGWPCTFSRSDVEILGT
jgi:hypothetical protein